MDTRTPFPIPVVALGPGSQFEDETLDYIRMPQGMSTWQPPRLPEPEDLKGHGDVRGTLQAVQQALREALQGQPAAPIVLDHLDAASRALLNQVLGEGEVAMRVAGALDAQESIYAGVWRVVQRDGDGVRDRIEIGAAPASVLEALGCQAHRGAALSAKAPAEVMNAPAILSELAEQWAQRAADAPAHVINLTLLPLVPVDLAWIEHELGEGPVLILSRGYGNCRISGTERPDTWRVVYFNSMDTKILDTIEVVRIPEVALAAREDLADSLERLGEALEWLEP